MERRAVVPRRHPVNADHSPEEHANNRLISFHSWVRKAAGDKCAEDASNLSNGSMGHEHTMKRQVYTGQEHFHTSSAQGKFTMGKCTPRTLQPFDRKRQCRMDKCAMGNFAMVKCTMGKRECTLAKLLPTDPKRPGDYMERVNSRLARESPRVCMEAIWAVGDD